MHLSPGQCSDRRAHGGDAAVFVLSGRLVVRCWFRDQVYVFEADPHDAVYLPEGATREIRNFEGGDATAMLAAAPSYLPR